MKTIVLEEPGSFRRTDTPEPEAAAAGQAVVLVRRIGICGTDLHAFRGRQPFFSYPRILGHELGVEVLDVGPGVEGVEVGSHYAVEPYLHCGTCPPCRQGRTNCCAQLQVLGVHADGGMRERIVVPAEKLHGSKDLQLEQLALVETLGIGAHAVERAALQKGEAVLVIGAGPIGLATVQFAQVAGARVAVMEVDPHRLEFCCAQFSVERGIAGGGEGLDQVRDWLGGELPSTVFDATGNAASMQGAFEYVESGGQLVFVGFQQGDISFSNPEFHRREMTLKSSRNSVADDFRRIIRLMEEGQVDTRPWISHRADYGDMVERFEGWLEPEEQVVKVVVDFD
ncbi:MAG: alcohol dehydrogenase catalytic domain-containing protein [Candidatus Latescibacteria bacterium]|nr:alcohol dehydrogenase catalytic domain-containing protein [Candidatus Latescibacterota bacterium]